MGVRILIIVEEKMLNEDGLMSRPRYFGRIVNQYIKINDKSNNSTNDK